MTATIQIDDDEAEAACPAAPGIMPPHEGLISRRALARVLKVSTRTLWSWVRHGCRGEKLRCAPVGSRLFFRWSDVLEWQERVRVAKFGRTTAPQTRRKSTSAEAKAVLEKNGFTPGV